MRLSPGLLGLALAFIATATNAQSAGDAVQGKAEFAICAACHSVTPGKNGFGPSLFGIVGRNAGTAPGYTYSAAMKGAAPWSPDRLNAFIESPKATVPGTSMPFVGLKDAQKRSNIIAYLKTLK